MSLKEAKQSINLENVVASSGVETELDLEQVARDMRGSEYNPEQFPGLVYRIQDPKVAVLMFRSGNIICTGAKGVEAVESAFDIIFAELQDLGIETGEINYRIQNMVASADVKQNMNLNAITIGLGLENVEYEPEQFPGLVYRPDDIEVVCLLFGSGKIVLTGGKNRDEINEGLEKVVGEVSDLGLIEI